MRVLVDTCVWSLALRRSAAPPCPEADALAGLIRDHRVAMIGPIRQEVLSGIRSERQFEALRQHLAAFVCEPLGTEDHVLAARFFNQCRAQGVQGSNTDFLICAVAVRLQLAIFTVDRDFDAFAEHLPIILHRNA